jgi:hypothetical protein
MYIKGQKKKVNFAMSISFANAQEDDNDRIEQSVLAVSCSPSLKSSSWDDQEAS